MMYQEWHHLLFAHWPVAPADIRRHIPPPLTLETFEGSAWIGVVPFEMRQVRPRLVPALPWISFFPELNVRTYVQHGDKPGVFFFSLDAANPVAVRVARRFFHLPYFDARMRCEVSGETIHYESVRTHRGADPAVFRASYHPTGDIIQQPSEFDLWLTERYALYALSPGDTLYRGEIHHVRWPLRPAAATIEENTMFDLPDVDPILHYAENIQVVVWNLSSK
jgi:uncharacterized protein YqjF (DUF2071 family)